MRGYVDPPGPQRAARRAAAKGARVGIERNGCQDIEAARAPDVDVDAGGAGDGRAIAAALRRMARRGAGVGEEARPFMRAAGYGDADVAAGRIACRAGAGDAAGRLRRSEEHTSELQSIMRISYAVL